MCGTSRLLSTTSTSSSVHLRRPQGREFIRVGACLLRRLSAGRAVRSFKPLPCTIPLQCGKEKTSIGRNQAASVLVGAVRTIMVQRTCPTPGLSHKKTISSHVWCPVATLLLHGPAFPGNANRYCHGSLLDHLCTDRRSGVVDRIRFRSASWVWWRPNALFIS